MVEIPRSSFIPKEAAGMTPGRVRRRRTFHIFGFVATVLLIGSIIAAGLVFFLEKSAKSNLEEIQQELARQESLFDPTHIAEVREFDRRIRTAEILIKNHISPLRIFAALERETKQRVQLTSFSLEHTPTEDVLVTVQGITPEFRTLALQESAYALDEILTDVLFSEVSTTEGSEETGGQRLVTFTLEGALRPDVILYNGQTQTSVAPLTFIETNDSELIVASSGAEPAVLGESVTLP